MDAINSPYPQYFDLDGSPLDAGYVWFGQAGLNPVTSPASVYWDAAGTQPAAQPVRTIGGYLSRSGAPAQIFMDGDYSSLVRNQRNQFICNAARLPVYISAATLAASGGSARIGHIATSTGAVATTVQAKLREWITPEDYGAAVAAVDNRAALQRAIDAAVLKGRPLRQDFIYDIQGPLYIPSELQWICDGGGLRNTYAGATSQMRLCIYPGTYSPAYYAGLTYKSGNAVSSMRNSLTLTTPGDAATFAVDDMVFVRSTEYYNGADGPIPLYGSLNRVTSSDAATGVLLLEYPILDTITSPLVAKTNGTGTLDILGERQIYTCCNARISGLALESVNGHTMERGGFLNCDFQFTSIAGLSGIYTNMACFSTITVGRIDCEIRAVEVGGCSTSTTMDVGSITYRKTARSTNSALISFNEMMFGCTVNIHELSADGYDYASQAMIHTLSARRNTCSIDRVLCAGLAGGAIVFENLLKNAVGETQPSTSGNTVKIGTMHAGAATQRFGYFLNVGGLNSHNSIDGIFYGTPTTSAVTMSGTLQDVRGSYEAGAISISTATNSKIDVEAVSLTGYTRTAGNAVTLNGRKQEENALISKMTPSVRAPLNGGGGAVVVTVDMSNGSAQATAFTSTTAVSVANPSNLAAGDELVLVLTNDNGATAITPTFGTAYKLGSAATVSIPAVGGRGVFRFISVISTELVLVSQGV